MESNHHSARQRFYGPWSSPDAQRSQREGGRPDSNRHRGDHDPGCCRYTTTTMKTGTTGLEPAASRWTAERSLPLSYVPSSAGGIRTRDLELMRLARTATPLPRNLPGWSRTSGLRFPKPAGWPCSPTGRCRAVPPAGVEPAPSRLRAGRHDRSTTGARKVGGPGIEPGPARYQRAVPPRTLASEAPVAGLEPAFHD